MLRFFLFCSGVSAGFIRRVPSENNKYAGIGAAIFFTGLYASIAAGYALYFVFNDADAPSRIGFSLIFGLLWGAMIFNIDRLIISTMRKKKNRWAEVKMAIPRLIFGAVIALVISKPIELQVFKTSIEYELEVMKQENILKQEEAIDIRFEKDKSNFSNRIDSLNHEITQKTNRRNALLEEALKEADGTGGSQKRGAAVIYKLKKTEATKAEFELDSIAKANQPLIDFYQQRLNSAIQKADSLKAEIKRGAFDGFDKRLEALSRVSATSQGIRWASWSIFLLFLLVEICPILVKLMMEKGPMDEVLETHELQFTLLENEKRTITRHESEQRINLKTNGGNT